jgi:HAD superfamily hydrolase (TIGR01509 family)
VLRALLWDVDGTIAETEGQGHRVAFNLAFADAGLAWRWDPPRYAELLEVSGGRERLLHDMAARPDAPADPAAREALVRDLYRAKTALYARIVAEGGIGARPGVLRVMAECAAAGVAQAIVTTTGRANVDALFPGIFGTAWRDRFAAIVCAEDAPVKKPHPQAYAVALARLGLDAADALAIEDSPNGLQAAAAAGVACCITRSLFFREGDFPGAALVCADLDGPPVIGLPELARAHAACASRLGAAGAGVVARLHPRDLA